MASERAAIYRRSALQRYLSNQQKIVFLRLVQPRLFPYFWALLFGLVALGYLAWRTQSPVTVDGVGIVVGVEGRRDAGPLDLLLLFPPQRQGALAPRQRVYFQLAGEGAPLTGRIESVEPQVLGPDAIRARFSLSASLGATIDGPAAVASARVSPGRSGLPSGAFDGVRQPVRVEVGTASLLSLLPGTDRLAGGRETR